MNIKRKIAIAAVPAVMALASTSVDSKILINESRRMGSIF